MLYMLFADTSATDVITGGAGWVGAGLLAVVLRWLLYVYLPAKDAQLQLLIEGKDVLAKDLASKHEEQICRLIADRDKADAEKRHDFKEALNMVVTHCKEESSRATDELRRVVTEFKDAMAGGVRGGRA